ncbi:hypothetical protein [Flavobacterium reichenbachii]|uniref:Lipoprotein n=1 Tax=Flavobacterium reichenbachii TaxID=362418 RepID=A0A085ZI93_9FLAO|nr:hypothetical protein [Flavobacterium reichenbachii]KFF04157.1 hypothetical protein IW19_00845 [Flavobacterium reichenbachii]OXB15797.1 hypothetical protein B0A68_09025 [Flavobacterium reichenbachii]
MRKYILLCIYLNLFSCSPTYNCDGLAENYKTDECLLIVKKLTDKYSRFNYIGINPVTKKECNCNSARSSRWWADYSGNIEIGDTIVKKKSELVFSIHKKDTVLSFNFECDGKVYK